MAGLVIAAVLILLGVAGYSWLNRSPDSNPPALVTPQQIPSERPVMNDVTRANQTIDAVGDSVNEALEQQQQRVEDIESQITGQ